MNKQSINELFSEQMHFNRFLLASDSDTTSFILFPDISFFYFCLIPLQKNNAFAFVIL